MFDMIFLLLVGVIASIGSYWVPQIAELNGGAPFGYIVANSTYLMWLAIDYFWSRSKNVYQKSTLKGSPIWAMWLISGFMSPVYQLLTFQLRDTVWNGPLGFISSFLAGCALLVIWNWVGDILYDVAQKRGKRNWS